ncbi:multicopper oxidase family protein [Goodfellowiella coeruleoviolacea]|uniref:Bilirubin oxidase n=1 Tax=Goodfellowiella coeruleoviolacea TaxID=334858 RepID=A0AAE3GB47_9PSEU|nr:multicopper oxidase domain-containing protein [Goodfellowiella coeruleoviolacea]MCP2163814.1 bilirubin oxidase [Goodfellowiella coeruleoviolacea]
MWWTLPKKTGRTGAPVVAPAPDSVAGVVVRAAQEELDPSRITKYVTPLVVPAVMPTDPGYPDSEIDYYTIGARQFQQQVLPRGLPRTTVWCYGAEGQSNTFSYPGRTIEARVDRPIQVTWVNGLVDRRGNFLPHLLPVDQTLHWANPPGGEQGRDSRPQFTTKPGPYTGPVPLVTHLHGARAGEESDGHAEAWYLPDAHDIPDGYARVGSYYEEFAEQYADEFGVRWTPGTASFFYDNDQPASTLWYHDHALGMTRVNIYAGLAGFYLLRGGAHDLADALPGSAPGEGGQGRSYEIPLLIQDRTFNVDGSLRYPTGPSPHTEGEHSTVEPATSGTGTREVISTSLWIPHYFGRVMVVNGNTWPNLDVEPRRYRFRLLNGCNSRTLILKLADNPLATRPANPALPLWQIGGDGGFLPTPVKLRQLLLGPAERADVVVDFTGLAPGTNLYLINEGPDTVFRGGLPGKDFPPADPNVSGQVLRFHVVDLVSEDTSVPPDKLGHLPTPPRPGEATVVRRLSLSETRLPDGSKVPVLGGVGQAGEPVPMHWHHPVSENPRVGDTEIWELHNYTDHAHPIHLHQVSFEVLGRKPFFDEGDHTRPPEVWETGPKDTVIAYTQEITRIKATFDRPGLFTWHCHLLEHEDNEMMRPYQVVGQDEEPEYPEDPDHPEDPDYPADPDYPEDPDETEPPEDGGPADDGDYGDVSGDIEDIGDIDIDDGDHADDIGDISDIGDTTDVGEWVDDVADVPGVADADGADDTGDTVGEQGAQGARAVRR